jgi:prepilin-type processing-associated H-X9-DG protein
MDQGERLGGRRKAGPIAGMLATATGCLMVLIVVALAAFLFPVVNGPRPSAQRASCSSNVKQLAMGLMMYCQDYDGKFPIAARWDTDVMPYIKNVTILRCPARQLPNGYAFNSKLSEADSSLLSSPESVPMLFESSSGSPGTADPLTSFVAPHNGNGCIAWADGHVTFVTAAPSPAVKLKKAGGK